MIDLLEVDNMTEKEIREAVYEANLSLKEHGLVIFTWGNVSMVDRERERFCIKPSGVSYEEMEPEDMVFVDFSGKTLGGDKKPSSDTMTHLALYKHFDEIGAVVHTHSTFATTFAQAGMELPCYGTTQADDFYGAVRVTRDMTKEEIALDYEWNTGLVMCERLKGEDPMQSPALLVKGHGPFAWGKDAMQAVHHAVVLEQCAHMAILTRLLNPCVDPLNQPLLDKHFLRKHGKNAYYGQ